MTAHLVTVHVPGREAPLTRTTDADTLAYLVELAARPFSTAHLFDHDVNLAIDGFPEVDEDGAVTLTGVVVRLSDESLAMFAAARRLGVPVPETGLSRDYSRES